MTDDLIRHVLWLTPSGRWQKPTSKSAVLRICRLRRLKGYTLKNPFLAFGEFHIFEKSYGLPRCAAGRLFIAQFHSDRLSRKVRVVGAKKEQGRRVLPVRKNLIFLQQRRNRAFLDNLICVLPFKTTSGNTPLMLDPKLAKDTIAAIATPPGDGGVGIIRISGSDCRSIAAKIFRAANPSFTDFKPYRLHYGHILDSQGRELDDVLCAFMPGPNSYTGEDVVEINCHGGRAILAAVLEEILRLGARLAERGEFTYRAFMNGRMDLTQAEAVAEMIHAPTKAAMHLAQVKLSGLLGQKIAALRMRLEELRTQLVIAVDFPEDEIECLSPETLAGTSADVRGEINALLSAVDRTRAWREGALVVIAGRVNAGKSSLMNALLGRNRAIVTDQPGTTRDYLEEAINLDGLNIRLTDTAGIRKTDDAIEAAGLEMGRELMEQADLVLFLADATGPLTDDALSTAQSLDTDKTLAVLNKSDLPGFDSAHGTSLADLGFEIMEISAKHGAAIDALCDRIRERVLHGAGQPDPDEIAPNARQAAVLNSAGEELLMLEEDVRMGIPYDLIGVRLETACNTLSDITGEITSADVLNSIFDSFCIGK